METCLVFSEFLPLQIFAFYSGIAHGDEYWTQSSALTSIMLPFFS